MSCGVGRRPGLDPALHSYAVTVCRPATVAPIRTLAWELPYAMGETLKSKSKKKKKKRRGSCSHKAHISRKFRVAQQGRDQALPQLWLRLQRQHHFSPWPGNFHSYGYGQKKPHDFSEAGSGKEGSTQLRK